MEVECNGEKPAVNFLSETESEGESVIQEPQESLGKSPSPEKKRNEFLSDYIITFKNFDSRV